MKTYLVELVETVTYNMTVEAENEDQAEEIARERWVQSSDPMKDFCGAGLGIDYCDVEEER